MGLWCRARPTDQRRQTLLVIIGPGLQKSHADAFLFSPSDDARVSAMIGWNEQNYIIWYSHRARDVERSAAFRKIANNTIYGTPTKLDRTRL